MGNPLHQRRTPLELAENSQLFEIKGKTGDFEQLSEIARASHAAQKADTVSPDWRDREVSGELRFGFFDAQSRIPAVTGRLAAQHDAVCQRCLEPFVLPLQADVHLVFGGEQGLERDGKVYEVWELEDDQLAVGELVEEALIMSIPFVTMHTDDASCKVMAAAGEERENMTLPFANLKAQMQQKD